MNLKENDLMQRVLRKPVQKANFFLQDPSLHM